MHGPGRDERCHEVAVRVTDDQQEQQRSREHSDAGRRAQLAEGGSVRTNGYEKKKKNTACQEKSGYMFIREPKINFFQSALM